MNKNGIREHIPVLALPLAFGIIVLILVQTSVIHRLFSLTAMQLPLPSQIAQQIIQHKSELISNAIVTLMPTVTGILIGGILGYALAVFATRFPVGGFGGLILMTALNSVPIVALATLMNRWFDSPFAAKTAVVIILTMGIMTVNAFRGLNDLKPQSHDLMYSYGATKRQIMWKLRIPGSLPDVFTALKINISAAMMGTIIAEFFASETAGLGFMIKYCLKVGNQKAQGWAYIVAAAALSLLLYGIVCFISNRVLIWHVSTNKK